MIPVYPLFLLAALAAAIPVVLHMINRQKAKHLPFSTLRFLRISVERTRRRKRVHDVLLMLMRMAVLVLIAVGLSEVRVTNLPWLSGGGETSAVVIILDNSASMGTVDQGRVRFRTALGAAEQIMRELRDGDQVALLLTGGPELTEQGKLDRTQEKVRQMLSQWGNAPSDTIGVSYQRADLAGKVRQARKLLAESDAVNKQIYVLSDRQKLSWEGLQKEDPPAAAEESDQHVSKKEKEALDVPVIFVDCNRAPKPNVAVTGVHLEAAVPVVGQPVKATVELFNAAPVAQQRHLELYVEGTNKKSSHVLNIPPGGRRRHEIEFSFERSGLRRGEVRLAGEDGSQLDDRRFFAIEINRGIAVAVVKAARHEIPYLEDTFYVEQALAAGKSGDWAIHTTTLLAGDLLSEPLSDYQVIFCVNLPALDPETAERLHTYVTGGGNLVWICGDNVDPAAYNQMNRQAGEQLLPAELLDVRTPGVGEGRDSWQISSLDKQHPALRRLVEPASLYRSVLVKKHLRLDTAGAADARVMARLDDGQALLIQRDVEEGRVLMLGTGAHVGWSNLPLRPIFMPLLVQLTFYLAEAAQAAHEILAGSPLVLPLEEETQPLAVEVLPPSGEIIRLRTEDQQVNQDQAFRYGNTHQVGVYLLRSLEGGPIRQVAYSVNLDPDETDPTEIDREELQKLFGRTPLVFADDPDDLSSTFEWLREGKSLWELFLAGVLIALVFETFLANRLGPKQEEDQGEQPPPGMRRLARKGRGAA